MSPYRPDLVQAWIFRVVPESLADPGGLRLLLIRRAPGRILPGLWQPVTGSLEADERVAAGALREVAEETGYGPDTIEAFYDLDAVFHFHEPTVDGVLTEAAFAVRVRTDAEPILSHEHDDLRWVTADEARRLVIWPSYLEAIGRIERIVLDDDAATWFELTVGGERKRG